MVAKSSPDWLPAGWAVQFRAQKRGRKIEVFTNLETGKQCFSKYDVMRYIKMARTNGEKPQPTTLHNQNHSEKIPSQLVVDATEYPEWLPDGWKVEVRMRKTGVNAGKEYKCYIDPSAKCSFYSKPEVFRYLKTVKRKSCKSRNFETVSRKRCIIKKKTITPLQNVVVEKHSVEDLPSGWTKEIKVKRVADRFRRDPYYTDPASGYVFRSKKDVMHYLETGEISRHAFKPKNKCNNELTLINDERHEDAPSSATKRQKFQHPVTRQQHSEDKGSSGMSGVELPETESSNLQDTRVPAESRVAFAFTADVVQEKHLTENMVEGCAKIMEDCSPIRSSQPKAELSDICEGKRSLLKVEGSVTDPGNMILAGNEPVSTTAASLNENNSLKILKETGKDRTDLGKSKRKEKLNLPRRSSKRLSGLEPELVTYLVSSERALPVVRRSRKSDGSEDVGLASDQSVDRAPQKTGAASETEVAHDTLTDIKSTSHDEPLNKGRMPLDDKVAPKEQQQKLETEKIVAQRPEPEVAHDIKPTSRDEPLNKGRMPLDDKVVPEEQQQKLEAVKMDAEKPEQELCYLFGSDPCLEFAFKTLTGELPIADTLDSTPILKPVADMLKEENSIGSGMKKSGVEKSCSRKTRANKSKKNKELKLPHRSSKRLAGVEPERLANTMSSERALRNESAKSSKSKAIRAVDLADEVSQHPEAVPVAKFSIHPCTTVNTSIQEEPSNKCERTLEDQAVPQQKPQEFETEKADVENPDPQFSFPFMDSWSDPCLDFAFKTLTGAIPIEDDLFQGYFQEKLDTSLNIRDSLALPDFGPSSFFQNDVFPQFDAPEQSVSGQQLPTSSSFLPPGNAIISNCSGVGSSQQLPMNPSFLPAGNVSLSNYSGVCSGQQLPTNFPFLPAGNMSFSNCVGVGSEKPRVGGSNDYHGKVKSPKRKLAPVCDLVHRFQ